MKKILFFIAFFATIAQAVFAANVFTSLANGTIMQSFYTNETVYLAPTAVNITTNSTSVRVYIVNDSNSWTNQTNLTDVSGGYKSFTTNSSGFLTTANSLWAPANTVGNYDVVIDVNSNGVYDQGIDFVFDSSTTGFVVLPIPAPTLTVAIGENNTANHVYSIPSNNTEVIMLQMKMSAGTYENVNLTSLSLIASGSGDDSKGISVVEFIADLNGNGVYDSGENLLAGTKYLRDNGALQLDIPGGYVIPANTTSYFLIIYKMTNSSLNGDMYSFQLASVSGQGATSGTAAKVSGYPLNSVVTTVSLAGATSTTTTSSITTTATATTSSTTSSTLGSIGSSSNFFWVYVAGGVSAVLIILFVVLYLRASRPPVQYEFKPPQ